MPFHRKLKVVFFGSPDLAVPFLRALHESDSYDVVGVITQSAKAAGRKQDQEMTSVHRFARRTVLDVDTPEDLTDPEFLRQMKLKKPDLFVVMAYGKIIPQTLLDLSSRGSINVHPSLLPKYRGASPIQGAIYAGESETGITIMLMDEKMDHGPILDQMVLRIGPKDTAMDLEEQVAKRGPEFLLDVLGRYANGKLKSIPQDHDEATFVKLLKRVDGQLDWTKNADEIERQVRAYFPWPGSFTHWNGKVLKVIQVETASLPGGKTAEPGSVLTNDKGGAVVATGRGGVSLMRVQLEGKKPAGIQDFVHGHSQFVGSKLD